MPERRNSSCPSSPAPLDTPKRRKPPRKLSPRIALYARVSSDQQAQHETLAAQLAAVQAFATARGLRIEPALIVADTGSSGTTLARPKLAALRDKAAAAESAQLLSLTPERRARKSTQQWLLGEEVKNLGGTLTCVNRQLATAPEDQVLRQRQGVLAEYEREKSGERPRRGNLHTAPPGKVGGLSGAPSGSVDIAATDTEAARSESQEREAAVGPRGFQLFVNAQPSSGAIARRRTAEQLPTRRDVGRWERSVVWARLPNPAYTGQAAYRKTAVVERHRPTQQARDPPFSPNHGHSSPRERPREDWSRRPGPALMSEAVVERAPARLEANNRVSPRKNNREEYVLSG